MTVHSFHPRFDQHRSANTWQLLLDTATSEQDVVHIARDFLASFTPHEIELLPESCRPRKIIDRNDIADYSYDLTVHRRDDEDDGAALILLFAHFFADAAQRVAQLARTGSSERESA